jgi:cytochrome c-type biogenesis protein CcmH/NrfG
VEAVVVSELEGREEFLRRSLEDLEREHDAGDLDDDDYAELKADYEQRLEVFAPDRRAIDRQSGAKTSAFALSTVFLIVVAVAAGILVARSTGRRESGQTLSGNAQSEVVVTTTTLPEALGRCLDLEAGDAIDCYTTYTESNPLDPDGWAAYGLFAIRAGIANENDQLIGAGVSFLQKALEVDPEYVPARVQLATVYLRTGRAEEARAELARLDGAEIPPDLVPLVDVLREELEGSATTTVP